jgi:MFS family permease
MIILTYPHTLAVVRHPHQLLYGGFSPELAALFPSLFALSLLLGMFVWLPLLRLLRRTTIMAIALCGAILSIVALACMNSLGRTAMQPPGYSYNSLVIAILLTLFGVFLLSGFTPSAWVQIAMLLDLHKQQRGTAMSIFSVMLSAGQFLGLIMGGVAVDLNGFTGFMVFSMVLVVIATASVLYTRLNEIDLLSNS